MKDYDDIRPFNDAEASSAMRRISGSPLVRKVSQYLFTDVPEDWISARLERLGGVDEFQRDFMVPAVRSILERTSDGFEACGLENICGPSVFISNHRDIVMDPALLQYTLFSNGLPFSDICAGDNLLGSPEVSDIMRSNRMIIVHRSLGTRENYESCIKLSSFIREEICLNKRSVWIAQRSGRSKDGKDDTSLGVLKMLALSGNGDFCEMFGALNIIPMSISYEYESCDALRARELYLSRDSVYTKAPGEDLNSMRTGIMQYKGRVHLSFGKRVTIEDLKPISELPKASRMDELRGLLNGRISEGYRLWPTNWIACDILSGNTAHMGSFYSSEEKSKFESYMEKQMASISGECPDTDAIRDIFLRIYANPALMK